MDDVSGLWIVVVVLALLVGCFVVGLLLGLLIRWLRTPRECSCAHPLSTHRSDGSCNDGRYATPEGESQRQWVPCRCVRFDGRVPRRLRQVPSVPAQREVG